MISNRAAKYLWDARRAAERITRFAAGRTFDNYVTDEMLRAAVERQFGIIGEAFAGLRRIDPVTAATIPDLALIIDFRNVLIHNYSTVDNRLVWQAIERDLPGLRAVLDRLLAEVSEP